MTTTVIPSLIDALVALGRAQLATVTTYDGTGSSDDPGDYLMVGVDDPDSTNAARSASSQADWATISYQDTDEIGDVTCAALSWNGNEDGQKAARDAVYAIYEAFGSALRLNPSLGLPNVLWTTLGATHELSQLQSADGVLAMLIFSVHFQARV